ncbi:MAG: CPBP family intramembrane metalloprotease [Acidobacteria bacterium]|nr:CPBP family intramembrane metalloprotease [Acidobacteriota bacterium]MBV9478631.1 CPBP family intramembrane metalloprotease [Acidobacteriota bacterium]
MKTIFVGPNGVRAGWRFLLFVVASMTLQNLLQFAVMKAGYKPSPGFNVLDFLISDGAGFVAMLAVATAFARWERRTVGSYGFPIRIAFGAKWWEGMLWGTLAPLAAMGMVVAAGGAHIDGLALHGAALAKAVVLWFVTMIVLGFFEEFLFRGYPFDALARGMGFWPAAWLLAILFGALHYFTKPMENWVDATTVGLLGLFMTFALRRTGDLWFSAGFHTAFDFIALNVLGAPNTGNDGKPLADRFLATRWTGADWITGGPRGLEASLFMFIVIAALFVAFDRRFPAKNREVQEPAVIEAALT